MREIYFRVPGDAEPGDLFATDHSIINGVDYKTARHLIRGGKIIDTIKLAPPQPAKGVTARAVHMRTVS